MLPTQYLLNTCQSLCQIGSIAFYMYTSSHVHAARTACSQCPSISQTRLATLPFLHTSSHLHVVCSFDISVKASPLDVVHYTVDPEDPSNGVCLSMLSVSWNGNMLMNQPSPRPARPGASAAEKSRQATFCSAASGQCSVLKEAICNMTQCCCMHWTLTAFYLLLTIHYDVASIIVITWTSASDTKMVL